MVVAEGLLPVTLKTLLVFNMIVVKVMIRMMIIINHNPDKVLQIF